jgi:hypothetical protein
MDEIAEIAKTGFEGVVRSLLDAGYHPDSIQAVFEHAVEQHGGWVWKADNKWHKVEGGLDGA